METFVNLLSALGAVAMFLFGMTQMSSGLEKFAGDKLGKVLSVMTKNRVMGIFTGMLVTMMLQSSSATTVIVVGLVTSGVMTLRQSIGVIMGANIGTTATVWLISIVGEMNISDIALPLLAFCLPAFFSKRSKVKSFSQTIFGFSLLFLGLSYLQDAANNLHLNDHVANLLSHIDCDRYYAILLFVLVGALITAVVQSSAATMAITLMLFGMNIPGFGFYQAAALAMGQNIGTTATALLGSMTGNRMSRRAAMAHMLFNVIGVVIILPVFYWACDAVDWFLKDVLHAEDNPKFKLSAFHTAFNAFNTLLLIWFVPQLEKIVYRIVPYSEEEEDFRLKYIPTGMISSTSELALSEVQNEIITFAERCKKMYDMVKNMMTIEKEADFVQELERVNKYEGITDKMELEIGNYINKVLEAGGLTKESKRKMLKMMKLVSELESIGDSCNNLGRTLSHKREKKLEYTSEQVDNINRMFKLLDSAIDNMIYMLNHTEGVKFDLTATMNIEKDINTFRKMLKEHSINDINESKYSYELGVIYMDFINECEHLGDYIVNVVQASNYAGGE
ncbi:MAG: Na/Pi cotransporter family protein [Bacteroidales bacterium]|nr:Na/Pi cotransporter family protein [Bacteroidales bacterium]